MTTVERRTRGQAKDRVAPGDPRQLRKHEEDEEVVKGIIARTSARQEPGQGERVDSGQAGGERERIHRPPDPCEKAITRRCDHQDQRRECELGVTHRPGRQGCDKQQRQPSGGAPRAAN
jgi:hypothetical protein